MRCRIEFVIESDGFAGRLSPPEAPKYTSNDVRPIPSSSRHSTSANRQSKPGPGFAVGVASNRKLRIVRIVLFEMAGTGLIRIETV